MTAPLIPARVAQPLDRLLDQSDDTLDLDALIAKWASQMGDGRYRPAEAVSVELYRMSQRETGRQILDWLFDLTARAPFPELGDSLEAAAMAAARHRARTGLGEVIAAAVAEGHRLTEQSKKEPIHEQTD